MFKNWFNRKDIREINQRFKLCKEFRERCVKTSNLLEEKGDFFWSEVVRSVSWAVPEDIDDVQKWRNMQLYFEVPNDIGKKIRYKIDVADFKIWFVQITEAVNNNMGKVPEEIYDLLEGVPC